MLKDRNAQRKARPTKFSQAKGRERHMDNPVLWVVVGVVGVLLLLVLFRGLGGKRGARGRGGLRRRWTFRR
jgi:hypothetical protein